jgi:hypothetical protein
MSPFPSRTSRPAGVDARRAGRDHAYSPQHAEHGGGTWIACTRAGSGPSLLMVHGVLADSRTWRWTPPTSHATALSSPGMCGLRTVVGHRRHLAAGHLPMPLRHSSRRSASTGRTSWAHSAPTVPSVAPAKCRCRTRSPSSRRVREVWPRARPPSWPIASWKCPSRDSRDRERRRRD